MADTQQLLQLYQQLQTDISQLRAEVQQLRGDNQQFRAEILAIRSENQSLRSSAAPASSSSTRHSLPDPPKFDGKPHMLRTWLPAMRAKLRAEEMEGQIAFYYVWDRLESSQQGLALPLLDTAESQQVWSHEDIFALLQRVHHNPYAQQEARDRLTRIHQGEEGLSSYIARFERLLYEAGARDTWPDDVKISTFTNGLRSTLKASVHQQLIVPPEYNAYIQLVQQLDRRSRPQASAPATTPASAPRPSATTHDPMQIGSINSIGTSLHAKSTSPDLRQERRKQGLCVRCGSNTHWVANCNLLPFLDDASALPSSQPTSPPSGQMTLFKYDYTLDSEEEDIEDFDEALHELRFSIASLSAIY